MGMLLVNDEKFLQNVQDRTHVTAYASGSVLCVQGTDEFEVRNASRMICCFLEDIRCMDAGPGLKLVMPRINALEKIYPNLKILIHATYVYIYCIHNDHLNEVLQEIVNILAEIREDIMGDTCPLLSRVPEILELKDKLKIDWVVEDNSIYAYGEVEKVDELWALMNHYSRQIQRVPIGARSPLILVGGNMEKLEKTYNCIVGLGEQGDNVLYIPLDGSSENQEDLEDKEEGDETT